MTVPRGESFSFAHFFFDFLYSTYSEAARRKMRLMICRGKGCPPHPPPPVCALFHTTFSARNFPECKYTVFDIFTYLRIFPRFIINCQEHARSSSFTRKSCTYHFAPAILHRFAIMVHLFTRLFTFAWCVRCVLCIYTSKGGARKGQFISRLNASKSLLERLCDFRLFSLMMCSSCTCVCVCIRLYAREWE